ncbi:nicotinate (nicotinamide) nucleotide adenylyltransferase [candidate division BRC1 bacterium HGW-BRC1-1]|nr:MAG: nicotinate (nicotinamide) nucleotide adenylyltransferase [candidate division BRC1 bacterium HGW-BRC1-1]
MTAVRPRAVGIFGGSFNPPHVGHVLACHFALMAWGLDGVVVVPTFAHPFAKPMAPYPHRLAMTRLAFAHLGAAVEISEVEKELGGVSYTVDTVQELAQRMPDVRLYLVVGSDVAEELPLWRDWDRLQELAPPLVVPRMGVVDDEDAGLFLPRVSSSALRDGLRNGQDVGLAVPQTVKEYIEANRLYR